MVYQWLSIIVYLCAAWCSLHWQVVEDDLIAWFRAAMVGSDPRIVKILEVGNFKLK